MWNQSLHQSCWTLLISGIKLKYSSIHPQSSSYITSKIPTAIQMFSLRSSICSITRIICSNCGYLNLDITAFLDRELTGTGGRIRTHGEGFGRPHFGFAYHYSFRYLIRVCGLDYIFTLSIDLGGGLSSLYG